MVVITNIIARVFNTPGIMVVSTVELAISGNSALKALPGFLKSIFKL